MASDPYFPDDFLTRDMVSAQDMLLLGLDTALLRLRETIMDVTDDEFHWEPLPEKERPADIALSGDTKHVWRVYPVGDQYAYDYGTRAPGNPAFTTIAWIMNHIGEAAAMYLHCIKTGKPAGEGLNWDELPVQSNVSDARAYLFETLESTRAYLLAMDADALNQKTPAPWGGMRPTFLNLWGGIIEHTIQHAMQIAVRKEYIRMGLVVSPQSPA